MDAPDPTQSGFAQSAKKPPTDPFGNNVNNSLQPGGVNRD